MHLKQIFSAKLTSISLKKNLVRFTFMLIAQLCILPLWTSAQQASTGQQIIAYVFPQGQRIDPGTIAAEKLTRINYAFAKLRSGKVVEGFPSDTKNLVALQKLKERNPSLSILISVGGWAWSGTFSDMALTARGRALFIDSAIRFIEKYNLDGLDLDWEYPGLPGAGNHFRKRDKQNYTLLLKELRQRFGEEEKHLGRPLFLSIAAGSNSENLENTEMARVQQYVNTVNLMAYDYYEPASDAVTGHHAPLYTTPADPKATSADDSVKAYLQAGVPAEKLVLGVPFYGHMWQRVPNRKHGLYQSGKPISDTYAKYTDITSKMLPNGYIRYWDPSASAPYLYHPGKRIFVSYDDPQSLTIKCQYIREHRLGGVMFWEYSSDPSGVLLDTLHQQLVGHSKSPTQ